MGVKKDEVAVARADVLRISLRGKPKRLRNTVIGMGIGAGLGLAVGAVADARSGGNPAFTGFGPDLGKRIYTPLGFVIGGVVGVAIPPSYRTIYRAEKKRGGGIT